MRGVKPAKGLAEAFNSATMLARASLSRSDDDDDDDDDVLERKS